MGCSAVLVSGEGSILEAILEAGEPVGVVVADRACRGLEVARVHGVEGLLVDRAAHGGFGASFNREGYTAAVIGELDARSVDLVCMAGFGTVLSPPFFSRFDGAVLNTHPSLLPRFRGWHAVRDALAAGASVTGCTVHLATAEVDEGPILRQEEVTVEPDDDEASLHERIKQVERRLYPATIHEVRTAIDRGDTASSLARPVEVPR
jgi:phosphoribosylglycinamide formyltransferase-1